MECLGLLNTRFYATLSITNAGKRLRTCLGRGDCKFGPRTFIICTQKGGLYVSYRLVVAGKSLLNDSKASHLVFFQAKTREKLAHVSTPDVSFACCPFVRPPLMLVLLSFSLSLSLVWLLSQKTTNPFLSLFLFR